MTQSTIIVTGAASGIGLATAQSLADDGASVIACDLQFDGPPAGANIHRHELDVTDQDAVHSLLASACDGLPPLAGAVCAAGIQHRHPTKDLAAADWHRVLSVHLDGALFVSQAAASLMTSGGSIVLFSSVAEFFGWSERAAYASAKAAVSALARTLAVEWADANIRVNSLGLGYVETPMILKARQRGQLPNDPAALHALGRMADVSDVTEPIRFLLSDASRFITGTTMAVDGGYRIFKGR